MSVSVVAIVWCLLSLTVAVSFCLCLLQPYWFIHNDNMTSLGIYTYCYHDNHHHDVITLTPPGGRPKRLDDDETRAGKDLALVSPTERCEVYGGGRFHFSKLPSSYWQASLVLVGSASVLSSVCGLMSVLTLCVARSRDSALAAATGYVQIIAVLLFVGGLAVFPVGLNSELVRQLCGGTSRSYWPGDCRLGWTCVLGVVSAGLAVFCPFLSRHIHISSHSYSVSRS